MRIAVITANEHRHQFFANFLAHNNPVRLVVAEPKVYDPRAVGETAAEDALVRRYFEDRTAAEHEILRGWTGFDLPDGCALLTTQAGQLHNPAVVAALETERIDTLAVFGTSLLKEPLLSMFPGRIVNIHLGLSPYYRGSATIFWALYNEQPELAGATIHYIDAGVDTGSIICHVQTTLDVADTPHTIGTRIIWNAVHAISSVLNRLQDGPVPGVPQWEPGEEVVTRRRDFTAVHLREFLDRWQAGLIRKCLERSEAERPSVRLIACDS